MSKATIFGLLVSIFAIGPLFAADSDDYGWTCHVLKGGHAIQRGDINIRPSNEENLIQLDKQKQQ